MKEINSALRINSNIPAIVLGSSITTLGVMRSLGWEKIPSIYISNHNGYITHSRWCKSTLITSEDLTDAHHLSNLLEKLPVEKAVLFPCSDPLLMAVASLAPEIKDRFVSCQAEPETINKLLDKAGLAEILSTYKLPHPKTLVIDEQTDLNELENENFDGVFLKPRNSQKFFKQYGVKAFNIANRENAIAKALDLQKSGHSLVLQEYIPGPKSNHYFIDGFVDRFGNLKTLFARRRIRMYPPDFGNSSYMYTIPLSEVSGAVASLEKLFDNFTYRGIFSTEFKYDYRDGLYKVIEINVRPWWYVQFASSCGINVCKLAYQDALEQDVSSFNGYKKGASLVYFYYDLQSCIELVKAKKLSVWSWLRSWWRPKYPIFRWDDPMPAIAKSFTWFGNFIKRRISKK